MLARLSSFEHQGWTVIGVHGELDLASAPEFQRLGRVAAMAVNAPRVIVDLSGCDLLDSVSLGVMLGIRRRVLQRDGELRVVAGERVARTFELTGTVDVFDIRHSLGAAAGG